MFIHFRSFARRHSFAPAQKIKPPGVLPDGLIKTTYAALEAGIIIPKQEDYTIFFQRRIELFVQEEYYEYIF